jgi:3,4-dihydroxy 2-butanone 4-phosphate synthase/GTP cyclohydrolase II
VRLRRPAPHGHGADRPEGVGALVYLPQEGRGIGLIEKLRAYNLQDKGLDTVEANVALGYRADPRDYGVGLQILEDLGLTKVRLLTNNPKKTDAFVYYGYGLEVVDQVPIIAPEEAERQKYLSAKRDKLGHRLPRAVANGASHPPDRTPDGRGPDPLPPGEGQGPPRRQLEGKVPP